jgi:thiol-disulfide isomerase/thioredoxin
MMAGLLTVASSLSLFALQPGDAVTLNALTKSDFVKGEAPKDWKTNEVYIFECWATWCVPCVAAIPHVDALYDKYHAKGLNVIGVNVFEDGKDKVAKFVAKKGDGMSYPVTYTGKGGVFEEEWLKPAGVDSIPHAFVVKNGKLLFMTHPASLTEKTIETILAGGEAETALVKKLNRANEKQVQEEIKALVGTFSRQAESRDFAAAKATIAKIKELDENYTALPALELGFAATQEKWDDVVSQLKQDKSSMTAMMLGVQLDTATNTIPPTVLEAVVNNMDGLENSDAIGYGVKAALLSKLGKKDDAYVAAEKAARAFISMTQGALPKEAFDAYVASYKTDKPMRLMEAFAVLQKGMPKSAR